MFKHILLPTDGSELSEMTIRRGLQFAKESNAKVTGISVTPEFHGLTFEAGLREDAREQFLAESRSLAKKHLAIVQAAAAEQGVTCDTEIEISDYPYEAIINAAERKGCDLILMASHGRRGVRGLLLGSETHKVLTHTRIPVLVYR
jgi:nucleotide-binding universal stress UspA family protein